MISEGIKYFMRTRATVLCSRACHHFRLGAHKRKACCHSRDAGKIAPASAAQVRNKIKMKEKKRREKKYPNYEEQGCRVITLPQ